MQEVAKLKLTIEETLPKYNSLLMTLRYFYPSSQTMHLILYLPRARKNLTSDHPEYITASRLRKSLMDHFSALDRIAKRLKSIPTPAAPYHRRFYDNFVKAIAQYLQTHMFTLQLMPNIEAKKESKVKEVRLDKIDAGGGGGKGSVVELEVLETQRRLVEGYLRDAKRERRGEDVKSLEVALGELEDEIQRMRVK